MLTEASALVGAVIDAGVISGTATLITPHLMQWIPYDRLGDTFKRLVINLLSDPNQRAVMATAKQFLVAWHEVEAERQAKIAAEAERAERAYRLRSVAEPDDETPKLHSIAELAKRDGVTLPWSPQRSANPQDATGASVPPSEPRKPGHEFSNTSGISPEEREAHRLQREARNRETWHELNAEHERRSIANERASSKSKSRTDVSTLEGKGDARQSEQSGWATPTHGGRNTSADEATQPTKGRRGTRRQA